MELANRAGRSSGGRKESNIAQQPIPGDGHVEVNWLSEDSMGESGGVDTTLKLGHLYLNELSQILVQEKGGGQFVWNPFIFRCVPRQYHPPVC